MDTKTQIENLLKTTERAGIEDLLAYMDAAGFYDAPCSSRFHYAKPGGLAEHSLNVLHNSHYIATSLYSDRITPEMFVSLTICALLHDLGKAGQFGKPAYIENEDPERGAYKTNKELLYIPHEVRSIAIAAKFIELTEEEQFAILYHNGLYGELQAVKNHETPLYMILHFADLWAAKVTESEETQ